MAVDTSESEPDIIMSATSSPNQSEREAHSNDDTEQFLAEITADCIKCLAEIEQFEKYLSENKREKSCELSHFKRNVKAELKFLERLNNKLRAGENVTGHVVRSSNFPFYATIWAAAKIFTGIAAFEKRFYWTLPPQPVSRADPGFKSKRTRNGERLNKQTSAIVDVVAEDGATWVKVSTISSRKMIYELAKAGWMFDSDDESEDGDMDESRDDSDNNDDARTFIKQAEALIRASKATRVRYQTPRIVILLPRLCRGENKFIDQQLLRVQRMGIEIQTAEEIKVPSLSMTDLLPRMIVDPYANITPTINVDCTILLALISDLSHQRVETEDWHHNALRRQIEVEAEDKLLPSSLWPACGARKLVCTAEAAQRMWEIVEQIGTETERTRARCLVQLDEPGWTRDQRLEGFRQLSDYKVPEDWQLPVEVVRVEAQEMLKSLPDVAHDVALELSDINQSVFFYGWLTGFTTISSNRTVTKLIDAAIAKRWEQQGAAASDKDAELRGPNVWLSPASRSLVGKEKDRRGLKEDA